MRPEAPTPASGRKALVLGGADCVWEDVERALDLGEFDGVVACNTIGVYWPGRITAWVSLHPEMFRPWTAGRARRGLPPALQCLGLRDVSARFPAQRGPGSSGLFALRVALDVLGFGRAVLAGIPMDPRPHFDRPGDWGAFAQYAPAFKEAVPDIGGRARSMSGWTAGLLGRPTEEWLS